MDAGARVVPRVVAALADGLARVLGERLAGVYLGGSISMGDFVRATSDFDVLIVTEGHLTPKDICAIDELHRRLATEYPDAQRLDGDYAPRHLLVPQGTSAPVPGVQRGQFEPDVREIMLSADNVANMRDSGITVYGPPADTVLPAVTPAEVRAAVLDMLQEGPGPCATEEDAAAEVLNLARSLCALETGQPTTKSQGAAWALAHLDEQWHEVIRRAEAIRRGQPVAADDARLRTALSAMERALRPRWWGRDPSRTQVDPEA
jgi:streptomycin 3"-adenylyltransferase